MASEKVVGHLYQDARPVASLGIGSACATMAQVNERLKASGNNVVRLDPLDVGHQPNPAGVVLEHRVVEALLFHPIVVV